MPVATIAAISASVATIAVAGLSLGLPLAITAVTAITTTAVATIAASVATIAEAGLSLGLSLGLPLAVAAISTAVAAISTTAITAIDTAITVAGISGGDRHEGSEDQKLHGCV